jgi:hypothetical protein
VQPLRAAFLDDLRRTPGRETGGAAAGDSGCDHARAHRAGARESGSAGATERVNAMQYEDDPDDEDLDEDDDDPEDDEEDEDDEETWQVRLT